MLASFFYLFISGAEIAIILFLIVVIFGADKIPDLARGLGKTMNEVKHATNDIKREIKSSSDSIKKDPLTKSIDDEMDKVKKDIEEFSGSIKRDV
ncbi:MAG: twin-arginine translocase TatA/TatE family subunit [Flavobacteriaceae bacterium]|jgi:sec-independent protein translocase protein TatA|nr:twin-arginine translocase TatA/TatE family subunit [Flavobacteriaceae bacterium]